MVVKEFGNDFRFSDPRFPVTPYCLVYITALHSALSFSCFPRCTIRLLKIGNMAVQLGLSNLSRILRYTVIVSKIGNMAVQLGLSNLSRILRYTVIVSKNGNMAVQLGL